jgi:hypothetical protein
MRDMDNILQKDAMEFDPPVIDTLASLGDLKRKINAKLRPPLPSNMCDLFIERESTSLQLLCPLSS